MLENGCLYAFFGTFDVARRMVVDYDGICVVEFIGDVLMYDFIVVEFLDVFVGILVVFYG